MDNKETTQIFIVSRPVSEAKNRSLSNVYAELGCETSEM